MTQDNTYTTNPSDDIADEREVHDVAAALATVAPVTLLDAMSVTLLGVAAALQEVAELPRAMAPSELIRRRIVEIDAALASADVGELGPEQIAGLQQERGRLAALLAADVLAS